MAVADVAEPRLDHNGRRVNMRVVVICKVASHMYRYELAVVSLFLWIHQSHVRSICGGLIQL